MPDGEMRYPGIDSAISQAPGKNRVMLYWRSTPDPTVSYYRIFWNNRSDSLELPSKSTKPYDTVRAYIPSLAEGSYSFSVYAYDRNGNRSVPRDVPVAKAYGSRYISNLYNRQLRSAKPGEYISADTLQLNFNIPDTINISTEIRFINQADAWQTAYVTPDAQSIKLGKIKPGSKVAYRSSYIPARGAVDTFYTLRYDTVQIVP